MILTTIKLHAQNFSTVSDGICSYAKYRCTPSTFNSSNLNVFEPANWGCFGNNILTINNINFSYFETTGSGTLNLSLTSTGNNVDYVYWGPLTSPRAACAGGLGTPISCGTGAGNETINLTGVSPEQFYVILTRSSVTNRPITFNKVSGSASVSCTNSSVCGDIDYDATEGSTSGPNIGDARTYSCGTNRILQLRAHNYNTAREHITPAMMSITDMNNRPIGSNFVKPIGVNINYCATVGGASQLPLFTLYFLFPQEYLSPSQGPQLGYQYCDTYAAPSSENMSFNIYDMASKNNLRSGTWNVVGNGGGPSCSSDVGGSSCQDERFNANLITGTAFYSCTSCGSALNTSDNGTGTLNISNLPVGVHNIVYNWNNGTGCSGTKTKVITITGSGNPNFSYAQSTYCNGQPNPTPSESSTSGTYTASPSGLSINAGNGTINIASSSAGTYTITKTLGSGGCASTHTQSITIGGGSANAGPNRTINCTTNSVTLNGSGGGSYSWSPSTGLSSTTSATPTATPTSTTTYTLTTTQAGCTATDQVTVSINTTPPNANAGANQNVTCASPSTTLNGSGGGTYSWSPATGLSATNIASPTATPNSTQTYTLTVTGTNGCTDTDQVTVNVNGALPSVNAGSNETTSCNNPTVTLNGSGSGTYLWSPSTGLSSTTIANPIANPTSTQIYTLTVTATNGCTATDQVTITVDETAPNGSAGNDITLDCNTTSSIFAATGGGTYSWATPNGTFNTATVNVSDTDTPGNYVLTTTGANGCTNISTATLTIDQTNPIANAGSAQTYSCGIASLTLDGTGSSGTGISYLWTGPNINSGANTSAPEISGAGTYTLVVTGSNGCSASDNVIITPDINLPTVNAGINQNITCINAIVTLDGTGSDTGSNFEYLWTSPTGNIIGNSNTINSEADLDGTYTLTITNTSNNCVASDDVIINQDTVTPVVSYIEDTLYLSCNNTTASINASNTSGNGNTYSWSTNNGTIDSGVNTSTPTVSADGEYTLTVTSANGCSNIDSPIVVVLIDTISPNIPILIPDTLNCNVNTVLIDASSTQGATNYIWSTNNGNIISGNNSSILEVDLEGDYLLIATASNGCSTTQSTLVSAKLKPLANIDANPIIGETPLNVDFDAINSIGLELIYDWSYLTNNISNNVEFTYTFDEIGEHIVGLIVTDVLGCTDTTEITIIVEEVSEIFIPNVFTPNGDNENENFEIENLYLYPENSIVIFNRWGDKVFEASPYINNWNGRNEIGGIKPIGDELVEGTYFFILYLTPGEKGINGTVELIKD